MLVELVIHEQNRVYRDRLITEQDERRYDGILRDLQEISERLRVAKTAFKSPLIFTDFLATREEMTSRISQSKTETIKYRAGIQLNEQ